MPGTGGVALFALKLSLAAGARVIVSSSSDEKLERVRQQYGRNILAVNYRNAKWHGEVLRLTDGAGVDIVVENGGASSVVQSVMCTRRGGIVSQVGYLGGQDPSGLKELIPTLIDRRINLRSVNCFPFFSFFFFNSFYHNAQVC